VSHAEHTTIDHHHADVDWDAQIALLEQGGQMYMPFFEQAVAWLSELRAPAGVRRVLDVGSGPGVATCVLAAAFRSAEVLAIDGAGALLERAASRATQLGFADRVRTLQANLPDEARSLPEADLIWASNSLHHVGDQQGAVDRLRRKLRPDGLLAVAEGGLPSRFMPTDIGFGRPGLQSRLQVANEDWFAAMRASLPGSKAAVDDWPSMLRSAGLSSVRSRAFLIDLPPPLEAHSRDFLCTHLSELRDRLGERLAADDLETLERLLDPDALDGLARRPDVFFLAARTVHIGSATA
jgi:SAM-dependent methyltransferase